MAADAKERAFVAWVDADGASALTDMVRMAADEPSLASKAAHAGFVVGWRAAFRECALKVGAMPIYAPGRDCVAWQEAVTEAGRMLERMAEEE